MTRNNKVIICGSPTAFASLPRRDQGRRKTDARFRNRGTASRIPWLANDEVQLVQRSEDWPYQGEIFRYNEWW